MISLLKELTAHCLANKIQELEFDGIKLHFHVSSMVDKSTVDLKPQNSDNIKEKPKGAIKEDILFHSV